MIKAYKIFGAEGHRQKQSFNASRQFVTFSGIKTTVLNADYTGTNEYSVLIVEAADEFACDEAMNGQFSDGLFENSKTGKVEAIDFEDVRKMYEHISSGNNKRFCIDINEDGSEAVTIFAIKAWLGIDDDSIETAEEVAAEVIKRNGGCRTGHSITEFLSGEHITFEC